MSKLIQEGELFYNDKYLREYIMGTVQELMENLNENVIHTFSTLYKVDTFRKSKEEYHVKVEIQRAVSDPHI